MALRFHHLCRTLAPRILSHSSRLCSGNRPLLGNSFSLQKVIKINIRPVRLCSTKVPVDGETGAVPLGKLDGRLNLMYTCGTCKTRNSHFISKQAYDKGVVIVTCESCNSKHLIADHLDWFRDMKEKNIEEIMAKKGEVVLKVRPVSDKVFEYSE